MAARIGTPMFGLGAAALNAARRPKRLPRATPAQTSAAWRAVAQAMSASPQQVAVAPSGGPAAAVPYDDGLPKDPIYAASIQDIINQRDALRGVYDPRRASAAVEVARSLTDQGLADGALMQVAGENDQGTTYGVKMYGPGQAERNAILGNANNFNARGTYFSSARNRADQQDRLQLTNARDAILRRLQQNQQEFVDQQSSDFTRLSGEERNLRGQYRDWQAGQQVPPAPVNPEVPGPGEAASSRPRMWVGANRPNLGPGWTVTRRGPNAPRNQRWVARRTG